ncbi:unnamed protein product [Nesidiocoris tenuis]|uniref:Uncharacterized protein n=1 Tax=Nesidiocoris tenuis TaxID=355587 RepID=A0A6H5HHD2_9HEMI|nr:unnamed protein product [Nesidiocoris tenuis]
MFFALSRRAATIRNHAAGWENFLSKGKGFLRIGGLGRESYYPERHHTNGATWRLLRWNTKYEKRRDGSEREKERLATPSQPGSG